MKKPFCLDLEGEVYTLGDLNMMLYNTETLDYPPVDVKHPSKPFFTGIIRQEVQTEDGTRPFLVYLPEGFPISGAGIYLYPESGKTAEQCLNEWKGMADATQTALIVLEALPDGWSKENIQREVSYSKEVFVKSISRVYFSLNEATYYICGLGDGAYIASAYGLLNSAIYSCILADGDYDLHPDLYRQLQGIRSDRDPIAKKTDVIMPAWFVNRKDETEGDVVEGLKKAAQVSQAGLQDSFRTVYRQELKTYRNNLDSIPIVEVSFTGAAKAATADEARLHEQMLRYALSFKRWLAIGNGSFRAARNYKDMGLVRKELETDGRSREYYVGIPSRHKELPEEKLPLVLAIHGYSCTGELFAESTEWHLLGDRRDFFTVYVSAFPSNTSFEGRTVPLPTWNAVGMKSDLDDVAYIGQVLDEVCASYPVDQERIYVTGHSNGSLMTQTLMAQIPKRFAAFAPQGAQYHMSLIGDKEEARRRTIPDDHILRPVWLMMGSDDIGDKDVIEEGNANDLFIEMMCKANGVDRKNEQILENGKYLTRTYTDENQVPLVKFTGVRNTPHTFTPEFADIYWDQFLCHFRRKEDGGITYVI